MLNSSGGNSSRAFIICKYTWKWIIFHHPVQCHFSPTVTQVVRTPNYFLFHD